jgi:hypothetical protein
VHVRANSEPNGGKPQPRRLDCLRHRLLMSDYALNRYDDQSLASSPRFRRKTMSRLRFTLGQLMAVVFYVGFLGIVGAVVGHFLAVKDARLNR